MVSWQMLLLIIVIVLMSLISLGWFGFTYIIASWTGWNFRKVSPYEKASEKIYKILHKTKLSERDTLVFVANLVETVGTQMPGVTIKDPLSIVDKVRTGETIVAGEALLVCADEIRAFIEKNYE